MKQIVSTLVLALGATLTMAVAAEKYPLTTCIVSDEKLGVNGKPHVFQHEGREVQLCCKDCLDDFKKDSAKYMAKLPAAPKK